MPRKVLVAARDLVFRAKLGAVVDGEGGEVVRDPAACDLAVIDLDQANWQPLVEALVARQVPVLAFAPHVRADVLRAARAGGATAVPNSEVEHRLRQLLAT